MKPRVLIAIDTYNTGGPGKLILQFLKYGGEDICTPVVAGFWRGPQRKWQFREAVEALGVEFNVLHQAFAFDPMAIVQAYRLARKNRIEILESHGYKSHLVCLVLKKILNIPWIAYVHGWTSENLKVELYNQIEKKVLRFADRVIPVSRNLGSRLQLGRNGAEKLVYIPNAAEPAAETAAIDIRKLLGIGGNEILLAVVGRLSPEKGHCHLVEALKSVHAAGAGFKAVIVGDGQEREAISSAILQAGLEKSVIMVGYQEDVSSYYQASDMLVMPSLSEGMPMAALEAMMHARPVVATTVGGIPEVVEDGLTGLLVEPANPGALADAIIRMIGSREQLEAMGRRGRKRVEAEFSTGKRVSSIERIYKEVTKDFRTRI